MERRGKNKMTESEGAKRWVHNSLFITDDHRVGNLGLFIGRLMSGAASVLVKSVVYATGK